jgi:hypothetical protein
MEIRISAKVFAEFVMGGPSKKSSTIRNILKPKSPEAQIPSGYYKRAIGIIRSYHEKNNDHSYLLKEMKMLHEEAETSETAQARAKRRSNLQAIESYMKAFASRKWKIKGCPRIHYSSNDVRISGTPDIAIQDGERLRLVKLGVRKAKETQDMVRVIFQAATSKIKISAHDVTYFDVSTGESISGKPSDSDLASVIEGGCKVLQQMIQSKPA